MNITLFRREFSQNKWLMAIIAAVVALYGSMVISMFDPKLGQALQDMSDAMPELFAAFGMSDTSNNLIEFINNYLCGFLFVLFPLILIVLLCSRTLAQPQEKGTLVWLLAAPLSRKTVIVTKAVNLLVCIFLQVVWIVVCCFGVSAVLFPNELDFWRFLALNSGLFCLLLLFGGICFFFACLFSESRFSVGIGSGICIAFFLLQMLSQVGEDNKWLKYLTPLTLFDSKAIATGENAALGCFLLLGGAVVLFLGGIAVFEKRDFSV